MIILIRLIATGVLCYYIYPETGWATTIGFLLIALSQELNSLWMDSLARKMALLDARIRRVLGG